VGDNVLDRKVDLIRAAGDLANSSEGRMHHHQIAGSQA
jgi:hypothetical protein